MNPARDFEASPSPDLILDRSIHVVAADPACLLAVNRECPDFVGRKAWHAVPTGLGTLARPMASLKGAIATGEPDATASLRLDVLRPDAEGGVQERWWSIAHAPLLKEAGRP